MAETGNIAKMAEKISNQLFVDFYWERVGEMNTNWDCVDPLHKKKTHPSDVVFFYDNPYAHSTTYVTCDLKSYGKGSITSSKIQEAVGSLALPCVAPKKANNGKRSTSIRTCLRKSAACSLSTITTENTIANSKPCSMV